MQNEHRVRVGGYYRHYKSGDVYRVRGISVFSGREYDGDGELMIEYESRDGLLKLFSAFEDYFCEQIAMDGTRRFELVS